MEELLVYFLAFPAIVGAVMEGLKKGNIIPPKWYVLTAVVLSVIMAVIATISLGWHWGVFAGGAVVIFAEQAGFDWVIFKPLLKLLMKK